MKALSIRQPWAWAILYAGKRLENRAWERGPRYMRDYRGPILIHASKGVGNLDEFHCAVEDIIELARDPLLAVVKRADGGPWRPRSELARGGIVGRARVDGVIRDEADFATYAANVADGERQRIWWAGGFALVLADVEPVPFVPWGGALGYFDVPDDYAARGAA